MAQVVGGVQAPKYIYLPNATVRYNKLTYTYEKTTTFNDTYTRPSDWLTLPEVNNGDEVIYMLVAVYENNPSYVGFALNGNFIVDWGNGDIQNYNSTGGVSQSNRINYTLNWVDYDNSTITSDGYKQAIIKITPQIPGTLTRFDINVFQSSFGTNAYSNILDIKMAGQNINSLRISGSQHPKLQQFEFIGSHSITNGTSIFSDSKFKKLVNFDMTNITNASQMFMNCVDLIELPSNFNTSGIVNTTQMFQNCPSLEKVTLDLTSSTTTYLMFYSCTKLIEVNLQNTDNVTNFNRTFEGCSKLETVTGLNTSSGTNMATMFQGCSSLIDVPQIDFTSCLNSSGMFYSCSSIIRFENGLINTQNVTNMSSMFYSCSSLIEIPKDFDTSSCTNMGSMFYGCSSLRKIPLLNTSNVTNMSNMFYSCGLIELPELDLSSVTDSTQMFRNCRNLTILPTLNLSSCLNTYLMFGECNNLKEINFSNTNNVTNFQQTF